jgi:CBS domain-containing protein
MPVRAVLQETKIRQLKSSPPICLQRRATLSEAIEAMRTHKASCVLVCDGEALAGILTERDILTKVAGEAVSLDSPVAEFMTPNPRVLMAEDRLSDAVRLMDSGDYRHVPIVNHISRVEAVISIHNIIDLLAEIFPEEVLNLPPRPNQYVTTQEGA